MQRPHYTNYDLTASRGITGCVRLATGTILFTVEAGTEFFLKLILVANPLPYKLSFQRDGQQLPLDQTIEIGLDFVRFKVVQHSHQGKYTLSCTNSVGEGHFSFQLNMAGKYKLVTKI